MGKAKRKPPKAEVLEDHAPTPEQMAKGTFVQGGNLATGKYERAGLAYRRIAVIDCMVNSGHLTQRQYNGLRRYRDVALVEDRSPLRDSLDKAAEGRSQGLGLPPGILRAAIELGRLERALGALRGIARAVAVDDVTVSQWAMDHGGAVMHHKQVGRKVVRSFVPTVEWLSRSVLDIRMAGERLAAEIGA